MDNFYICSNGFEAMNLNEILFIQGFSDDTDKDRPITIKFKNGNGMTTDIPYARKIVAAMKKAIEKDTASPSAEEQRADQ